MQELFERLARVETDIGSLKTTVSATAVDVRAIREHLISARATRRASFKTLSIIGGVVTFAATVYAAFQGAFAKILG